MSRQPVSNDPQPSLNIWPLIYGGVFFLTMLTIAVPLAHLELFTLELPLLIGTILLGVAVLFTHPALLCPYSILVAVVSHLFFPESTLNTPFLWIAIILTAITVLGFAFTRKTFPQIKRSKKAKSEPTFEASSEVISGSEPEESSPVINETPEVVEITAVTEESKAPYDTTIASEGITIIFGTESGNCEDLATQAADSLKGDGYTVQVLDAENVQIDYLPSFANVLVITSTWGDGEPPSNAEALMEKMKGGAKPDMSGSQFSVLALGDTSYEQFCQCGKDFDTLFAQFGSHRSHERVDCDLDFEESYETWIAGVQTAFKASGLKKKTGAPIGAA